MANMPFFSSIYRAKRAGSATASRGAMISSDFGSVHPVSSRGRYPSAAHFGIVRPLTTSSCALGSTEPWLTSCPSPRNLEASDRLEQTVFGTGTHLKGSIMMRVLIIPVAAIALALSAAGAIAQTGGASGTSGGAVAKSGSDATAPMAATGPRAAMAKATTKGKKKKKAKKM